MKNKLTAQDIIQFFQEKPIFSRPDSMQYGWSPTSGGLYSITDFYKYFEEKGIGTKEVDDAKCVCHLKTIKVKNYNPDYSKGPDFTYYYYDISEEEALKLKEMYEKESKASMVLQIEKTKAIKLSLSQSIKAKNKKPVKI